MKWINLQFDLSGKHLKLFLISRPASYMRFFGSFWFWDKLQGNTLPCWDPFVKSLKRLNSRLDQFDLELCTSLLARRSADRKLAEAAFLATGSQQGNSLILYHGFLQIAVFDRMAFSLMDHLEVKAMYQGPLVSVDHAVSARAGKQLANCDDWKAITDDFFALIKIPDDSSQLSGSSAVQQLQGQGAGGDVVASLVCCADRSDKVARYSTTKFNFCMASLGFIALSLVSLVSSESLPLLRDPSKKKPSDDSRETLVPRLL